MVEKGHNRELAALINLLDEPDEMAFARIRERIFSFGPEAIPDLEAALENMFDLHVQDRIEELVKGIRNDALANELVNWASFGSSDLLSGYLLATRTQYPGVDQEALMQQVEQIKMDAWLELNENLTALENIKVLNHILYDVHRFEPNKVDLLAPDNSYLNTLLKTRKGTPLSLGILYIIIAQKLNVPVYGVNLPQHFILAYTTEIVRPLPDENDVLFYINPFNTGAIFTRKEIELFIHQLKVQPNESFFAPCTNVDIIKRLLMNLKHGYARAGNHEKSEELDNFLNLI